MPKDKVLSTSASTSATSVKTPIDSKHIDPNDLRVMEGALRAVESFMATEGGREALMKVRVGFDLVPPEGKDCDYKSSSNLSIDVQAVRNLPRAREDVLKRYEEEKKRIDEIRRQKQAKCPTSIRSATSSTVTSSSASSLSDRTQTTRQPAGGDDSQSSSASTAPTSPFYEGAKNALNNTMLMGTPHDPIQWKKLSDTPKEREETPKKVATQKATALEIPSATVFAVKGAGTSVDDGARVPISPMRSDTQKSAKSITFSPISVESPMMQKRIEKIEKEERGKKRREEEEEMKKREEGERRRNVQEEKEKDKRISSSVSSELPKGCADQPKGMKESSPSPLLSSHPIGSAVSSRTATALQILRRSTGWITDLYHHYLLHLLASLGRAFPAVEAPESPPRRGQIPYPLQRAIRRALPSVETFAVRLATNEVKKIEVKKESKREVKRERKGETKKESKRKTKKEVKKEKRVDESVKTAPTQKSLGVSPRRENETTSKTAEEISSGRDTVSKREMESPLKKKPQYDLPSPLPSPTEQSIGVREVQSSHRSVDSTYHKDEDTLNNIKSIEEDDCYTKRTESDTSIISDNPAYPEASFDFRRVGDKRTEISLQVLVHTNKTFSPIVPQPRGCVPNLSMEPL